MKSPRVLAALLLLVLMTATLARPGSEAQAHAQLLRTSPSANEELTGSPSVIQLWFSEDVSPANNAIRLLDSAGTVVSLGEVGHGENGQTIKAAIPGALDDGTYAVTWAVVSADGHVIRGSFVFAVGQPLDAGAIGPVGTPTTPLWADVAASAARSVAYVLALALTGALLFVVVPARTALARRLRRPLTACAVILFVMAPVVVAAEGLVSTAGEVGDLWTSTTRNLLWDGRHLPAMIIVLTGTLAALATVYLAPRRVQIARVGAIAAAVTLAVGFAWSGHPAADSPQWLAIGMNTLHVLSAGAWAGGLAVLIAAARAMRGSEQRHELAAGFSRLAAVAFPLALLSGTYLSWRILPGLSALVETNYGRLLLLKIGVLVIAAGFAAWNRWRLLPRLGIDMDIALVFRRFVGVELCLVLVTAVVTGSLTGESPRSANAVDGPGAPQDILPGAESDVFLGAYHFVVEVTPGRQGTNDIAVEMHVFDNATPAPREVEVIFSHPATDTGPFRVTLDRAGAGRYRATGQLFPLSGTWSMTLVVRVDEFEQLRDTFELEVR